MTLLLLLILLTTTGGQMKALETIVDLMMKMMKLDLLMYYHQKGKRQEIHLKDTLKIQWLQDGETLKHQ